MVLWPIAPNKPIQDVAADCVDNDIDPCQNAVRWNGRVRQRRQQWIGHDKNVLILSKLAQCE